MRKYFRITFFLTAFGILVVLKQIKAGEDVQDVQKPVLNNLPTPTISPVSSNSLSNTTPAPTLQRIFKNGTYTGKVVDAFYGNIQVQAVIQNGKISEVLFLQYPNENRTSIFVNSQAMPLLKQEAIRVQSAQVDIVSGASASSDAFKVSLADALSKAK
jgi:uncharacterized protein with FMN-binding domain